MKIADYRKIAPALNADLAAVFEKHGLKMGKLNASIEERMGTVRYSIQCADMNATAADGSATTPEAERYKAYCALRDLKPEWLGELFSMGRQTLKVTGLRDTRSAKCVTVTDVNNGKAYVCTPEQVAGAFALKAMRGAA